MTQEPPDVPISQLSLSELTRRRLMIRSGLWAASAAVAMRLVAEPVSAEEATAVAVDPAKLDQLIELSRTLCGGGNFSADRATSLMQLISADPELAAGLDELLANPPVAGEPLGSAKALLTAQAILIFWYTDVFNGEPLPDRSTAYYQLTSWQAMYTYSWAVCKAYGAWADPPRTDPIVPGNAPMSTPAS